ncbi:MAG: GNAT family N-acetyltransferase [Firmicutes bacterium]|nr:GNAT family N-acetyltransferase [Bacillota bacterium]
MAADDRIVGYIFSRRWGEIGWIGTFGIHPDRRGRGLGRLLLETAARHLCGAGCTVIGLETMPESPYNVGLYLRSDFRLIHPTVHMTKDLGPIPVDGEEYSLFSAVEKAPALAAAAALSRAVSPGLDYAVEVQNAGEFGWGETLLFGRVDPWALAVVRTVSKCGETPEPQAEVNPLIVHPEKASRLENVLAAVEAFAYRRGFRQSALLVNAVDAEALRAVLDRGYRVANVRLRMILGRD